MVNAGCGDKKRGKKAPKSKNRRAGATTSPNTSGPPTLPSALSNTPDTAPPTVPDYDILLRPLHSALSNTPDTAPPPDYTTRRFISLITEGKPKSKSTSKINDQADLSNYENLEMTHSRLLIDVFKAKVKGKPDMVTIEMVKHFDCEAAIQHQIEIYTYLQKGRKVTEDDGLTHLIAHGKGTSSFQEYQGNTPIIVNLTGPFLITDYYGQSVYNRWVSSKDKIIPGLHMFNFKAACKFHSELTVLLHELHVRGVGHGDVRFENAVLKPISEGNDEGVDDMLLTGLSYAAILQVKHKKSERLKIYTPEESESRHPKVLLGYPLTRKADIFGLLRLTMKSLGGILPMISPSDLQNRSESELNGVIKDLLEFNQDSLGPPERVRKVNLMQALMKEFNKIPESGEPNYLEFQRIYSGFLSEAEKSGNFVWYPGFTSRQ